MKKRYVRNYVTNISCNTVCQFFVLFVLLFAAFELEYLELHNERPQKYFYHILLKLRRNRCHLE